MLSGQVVGTTRFSFKPASAKECGELLPGALAPADDEHLNSASEPLSMIVSTALIRPNGTPWGNHVLVHQSQDQCITYWLPR